MEDILKIVLILSFILSLVVILDNKDANIFNITLGLGTMISIGVFLVKTRRGMYN